MALSRIKTWVAAEVLTASDLNAEFNNILNNALSLVSPWTGNMSAGGFRLTSLAAGSVTDPALQFTGDANTGIFSSATDTVDVAVGGVRGLQVTTIASAVNYLDLRPSVAAADVTVEAEGTDTNIDINYRTKGTGLHVFTGAVENPTISGAAPATPTANVLYTDSIVKGWVETSGSGAWTIDDDVNVSSITDNGVGDFTINWATAFASANYAIGGTAIRPSGSPATIMETTATAKSASAVRIIVYDTAAVLVDPTGVSVIAIGDQ